MATLRSYVPAVMFTLSFGCAGSSEPATVALSPVPVETVDVFRDHRPSRAYVAVGRFVVDGDPSGRRSDEALLAEARREAASMGANAILVTTLPPAPAHTVRGQARGRGGVEVQGTTTGPAYDVTAVVWRCEPR